MAETKSSLVSSLLALLLLLANMASTNAVTCTDASTDTLRDQICADTNLSTLCNRVNADSALRTLLDSQSADYTVFAPNNAAFARAGTRAGITQQQMRWTIQYHVATGELELNSGLTCGSSVNMLLTAAGGTAYTTTTNCDTGNTALVSQRGNFLIRSLGDDGVPEFQGTTPITPVTACNGRLYTIDNVMGFNSVITRWGAGPAPCDFFGPKSCKGSKGGRSVVVVREDANGNIIIVDNVFVPKSFKSPKYGAKGGWGWNAPVAAVQQNILFDWFGVGRGGYYGRYPKKDAKKSKKGYYGYYGPPRGGGGGFSYYKGYYGPKKGKWRDRRNLRASSSSADRDILDIVDWGDNNNADNAASPYEADPYDYVEVYDEFAELYDYDVEDETEQ